MRRISYWILSTLSAVVLLVGFDASRHNSTVTAVPPTSSVSTGTTSSGSGNTHAGSGTSGSHKSKGGTGTSTVTGTVAQTQWGPVQVQLTVSGGRISKVEVLQYPNGNSRDSEINGYALPILTRETTAQQSASIDMVSGATITSQGYLQSLQSALDQANL